MAATPILPIKLFVSLEHRHSDDSFSYALHFQMHGASYALRVEPSQRKRQIRVQCQMCLIFAMPKSESDNTFACCFVIIIIGFVVLVCVCVFLLLFFIGSMECNVRLKCQGLTVVLLKWLMGILAWTNTRTIITSCLCAKEHNKLPMCLQIACTGLV